MHGDRSFGDDPAIKCGLARLGGHKVMLIGHHKGKDTKEKVKCSFGLAHPEGYRKALRCMKLAEKFGLPVVTLIDTPGAYPGIGAEERGQAESIARNLMEMSRLRTPIVSIVTGEGGSGGALGIGVADRVAMMEFAWYSVISPEACSAILFKGNEKASEARRESEADQLASPPTRRDRHHHPRAARRSPSRPPHRRPQPRPIHRQDTPQFHRQKRKDGHPARTPLRKIPQHRRIRRHRPPRNPQTRVNSQKIPPASENPAAPPRGNFLRRVDRCVRIPPRQSRWALAWRGGVTLWRIIGEKKGPGQNSQKPRAECPPQTACGGHCPWEPTAFHDSATFRPPRSLSRATDLPDLKRTQCHDAECV